MNRTHKNDRKEGNSPGEDELGVHKIVCDTTNVWDELRIRVYAIQLPPQHLTAKLEQREMTVQECH